MSTNNERYELNKNLAQMLKGGMIMDVTTPEQAKIAEAAGACAVMALERIPADIRAAGGVSRMSDPKMIKGIQEAVSIPVMAKCRIGHFAEAQVLQAIEIDYIDESEVLSPADDVYHINKREFGVPFVCGAPFVESVHADASGNTPEILSIVENRIVGVKYKNQMAFAFHPELDQDTRIHEAFLGMIR